MGTRQVELNRFLHCAGCDRGVNNQTLTLQGGAEEFLKSDGYKAIAGGDEKDNLDKGKG